MVLVDETAERSHIIGYHTLIGNMLNVFQVALPEGETPPFPE